MMILMQISRRTQPQKLPKPRPQLKRYTICIENDEFCIENDEFCIENDEFCIENDDLRKVADGDADEESGEELEGTEESLRQANEKKKKKRHEKAQKDAAKKKKKGKHQNKKKNKNKKKEAEKEAADVDVEDGSIHNDILGMDDASDIVRSVFNGRSLIFYPRILISSLEKSAILII